jgi:hypothetical protein
MWIDLINVTIAAATLAITVVIYSLGRRIGLRATMERRADVARELATFSERIYRDGQNSTLLLMNATRYSRGDYTAYQDVGKATLAWRGQLFIGGEFVGLRHDGFEMLTGASAAGYPDALEMLFVPFDRVQWVNLEGDENFNRVIIYTSFAGPFPMPQSYSYPVDKKPFQLRQGGRSYYRRIDGVKLARTNGLHAWWSTPARWWRAIRFDRAQRRAERRFDRSTAH